MPSDLNMQLPGEESPDGAIQDEDFKVLGSKKKGKTIKVKPNLPQWMSQSNRFNGDIQNDSSPLDEFEPILHPKMLNILKKNEIKKLFPVQRVVVPHLVECMDKMSVSQMRDVCVISPTGSGKTLAYAIPLVNHLMHRIVTQIRALIILPVSDLAAQVYKVFQSLCKDTTLRVGLAITSSKKKKDFLKFYRKSIENGERYLCLCDILIATPGTLIDLIRRDETFHLKHLEMLVIDEADRMMNETQFEWLKEIEHSVYGSEERYYCPCTVLTYPSNTLPCIETMCACSMYQSTVGRKSFLKILFSATFTTDPEKIDNLVLFSPLMFNNISNMKGQEVRTVSEPNPTIPDDLREMMVIIDLDKKPLVIWHLIKNLNYDKILCFTDSIHNTHRLYQLMKNVPGVVVREFSSKQHIKKREKILKKFESGEINMIISTDIFARGLDIGGIKCVICYDPPRNETAYIHRIGRTARAGNLGTAVSLVTREQLRHFTIVARRAHQGKRESVEKLTIKNADLKPLLPEYQEALRSLEVDAKTEHKSALMRKQHQISKSRFAG